MKAWRLLGVMGLFATAGFPAQRERQITPPIESRQEQRQKDSAQYSRRFFTQLKAIFGRFRESDLDRVFESAEPIQCSELVNDKGEWRTVAFFNEKRELGDWYRSNLDEVKRDLAVFIFKGVCRGDHSPVQLATKFPVTESIEAYTQQKIGLDDVEVNVNAPVRASFESQTSAYTWDLPYLFLIKHDESGEIYSLDPPTLVDREHYATDVIHHWDCKSVTAEAVTYQFLICKTTTLPRLSLARNQNQRPAFGATAYFILSDGQEASSNVRLTFSDTNDAEHEVEDLSAGGNSSAEPQKAASWETPDSEEKIVDVLRDDFRIHFGPAWTSRIGSAQVLYGHQITSLDSANPPEGADYCIWLAGAAGSGSHVVGNAADEIIDYSITVHDRDDQASTSIMFEMKTAAGTRLGSLQCNFPRATSAASVDFARWKSIVGDNLTLEVRP